MFRLGSLLSSWRCCSSRESREEADSVPVDWLGLLLLSSGLLFLLFGFTRAGDEGWTEHGGDWGAACWHCHAGRCSSL